MEKEQIRGQIREYKQYEMLIRKGLYYRLTNPQKETAGAWEFVSEDGAEALVGVVMQEVHGNMNVTYIRLKGLLSGCRYQEQSTGRIFASDALMEAGIPLPEQSGEYRAYQMHFKKI